MYICISGGWRVMGLYGARVYGEGAVPQASGTLADHLGQYIWKMRFVESLQHPFRLIPECGRT